MGKRLVKNFEEYQKFVSEPIFISQKIFNKKLIAVRIIRALMLNETVYVDMCMLDLSKTLMHDFLYNYIKKKYGHEAKLLFTKTDV